MDVDVPAPDEAVKPEPYRRGAFGALAFPALGVLASQILFAVPEGHLDRPSPRVAGGNLGTGGGEVGGEEKVVGLDSFGVANDHEADEVALVHAVPQHVADIY